MMTEVDRSVQGCTFLRFFEISTLNKQARSSPSYTGKTISIIVFNSLLKQKNLGSQQVDSRQQISLSLVLYHDEQTYLTHEL